MAHIFANGIQENASAPGTGAVTLTGAVPGYRQFSSKCAVGDTVHYRIETVNGLGIPQGDWEVGRGTYSAANTLTRTTVIESSNANAAVNFASTCRVQLTVLAPNTSTQVLADWVSVLTIDTTNTAQTITAQKTFSGVQQIFTGVAGAMAASDSTATVLVNNNGGTGDSNLAMIGFQATGNYGIKLGIRADGYFGLGGWSRATWSWYSAPNGDMVAAGNVTAYSDERLKKNWKDLPKNYVVRLAKVKVGVFDRTDTKLRQVGVSAQSLRKLLPWAVLKGMDGDTLGVAYGNAAMASAVELAKDNVALRKEVKEQNKIIKALARRLDKLEGKKKK